MFLLQFYGSTGSRRSEYDLVEKSLSTASSVHAGTGYEVATGIISTGLSPPIHPPVCPNMGLPRS